jgi:hypothetical protein
MHSRSTDRLCEVDSPNLISSEIRSAAFTGYLDDRLSQNDLPARLPTRTRFRRNLFAARLPNLFATRRTIKLTRAVLQVFGHAIWPKLEPFRRISMRTGEEPSAKDQLKKRPQPKSI